MKFRIMTDGTQFKIQHNERLFGGWADLQIDHTGSVDIFGGGYFDYLCNVKYFESKKKAIAFIREKFGTEAEIITEWRIV